MEGKARRKIIGTICCICRRMKGEEGWEQVAETSSAALSHGYCPECYRQVMIDYGLASPREKLPEERTATAMGKSS